MSTPDEGDRASLLGSSAVMAAGTVVSRLSGYVRAVLLAAALGTQLHADIFTTANTIPTMLYILVAGGVFNAVLVPQLVRAMKHDEDGGEAFTNRLVTVALLFLAVVTALLVVAAPWIMDVYLDDAYDDPALAEQKQSAIDFARYCLPQVFFYGAFVLVGQVLNARGRFGPMMWAPIANNVVAVLVLVAYLLAYGPVPQSGLESAYSTDRELLLGLGSTLGIAVQFLVLVPSLRAAGFRFRPRLDLRGSGLGHTLRLGVWTLLFVLVNQAAYTVVVRLASSGTAEAAVAGAGSEPGSGYTVYSGAYLLVMVPHAIVTVSLATAVLPRLSARAADDDLGGLGGEVASTLRTVLALVLPFALLLPVVATQVATAVYGWGAARSTAYLYAAPLSVFAIGLVAFTVHFVVLRGFYALERTRTAFLVQCVIAVANVATAVVVVDLVDPEHTATALAASWGGAYAVGAATSFLVLRRTTGRLDGRRTAGFALRALLAAGAAAALAAGALALLEGALPADPGPLPSALAGGAAAAVAGVAYLLLARLARLDEVNELVALVARRLPGR